MTNVEMVSLINQDRIYLLLFLNAFIVIIGYAMAVATGSASVDVVKVIKILLLIYSSIWLLMQKDCQVSLIATKNTQLILGLCLILPVFTLLSNDIMRSLNRASNFVLPLLYVWLSTSILIYRYGQRKVLDLFSNMVMIIYAIPMISFLIFGGDFSGESIYGRNEEMVFVSNHFGWSAALFLIANLHGSKGKIKNSFIKLVWYFFIFLAVYLLIVSGNRTSLLAVGLALLINLIYNKKMSLKKKVLIVFAPIILVTYLTSKGNDAVTFVIDRSVRQKETGIEGRLVRFRAINSKVSENPMVLLTGVGFYNPGAFSTNSMVMPGYHNSYFELLFGLGLPVFTLFMFFMLFEPIRQIINRVSRYDLLFIPLAIIPFFEGNLTSGQFLFFPWFAYIIALNSERKFAYFGKKNWFLFIDLSKFKTEVPKIKNTMPRDY
ncbi:O-antigen ligase family protein [Robiginitalea aurantiaca]|uniref:O-antigen ligase family protein n=1 Tax=Robiginitalea aurantiaca TaxID=3056915 RepID=A0ABT7WE01_9FLAO|nr:O-antigen ligase family protein [Robiginitalea aurantiaca]MDM9631135.1 O-antigen ligase family protein [Robiginitalea aurantiaca]